MADLLLGSTTEPAAPRHASSTRRAMSGVCLQEYPFYHDKPGWSEHDAANYWTVACHFDPRLPGAARAG